MKKVVLLIFSALICGVVFTRCSSYAELITDKPFSETYEESEWWQPILQKHNLQLGAYNNFDDVFVMGMEGNSIDNGICILKAATALIKNKDNSYMLVKADSIYYNIGGANCRRLRAIRSFFHKSKTCFSNNYCVL